MVVGALQGGILDRGACDKSHRIERSSSWDHTQDPSLCEDAPVIIAAAALAARRFSSRALGYHTERQEEAPIHATAGHHPSLRLAANRVFHGRTPMIDGCSRGGGSRGGGDAHGRGAGHNGQLGSGSNVDTKVCKAVPVPLHLPPQLPATLLLPLFSRRRRSSCALPYSCSRDRPLNTHRRLTRPDMLVPPWTRSASSRAQWPHSAARGGAGGAGNCTPVSRRSECGACVLCRPRLGQWEYRV